MKDEEIIQNAAQEFYDNEWSFRWSVPNRSVLDIIEILKSQLGNFYTPEFKAIFLDKLFSIFSKDNDESKDKERMLFHIKQELSILPAIVHPKKLDQTMSDRVKIFISYSHIDKDYVNKMKRHFVPFRDKLDLWDDTKIEVGQNWKVEIKKAIDAAKVAILFISADFFASKFIAENELPPLLKAADIEGATIISIIVKPCLFDEFPQLSQYQAMNDPQKSLIKMQEDETEELWTNVVRQTKKILESNNT
ncbi:toll/interleukin-1 receptor domain-containing protein [Emticicia sp. TH156]|uniref:toll/interleukin-1 receptor domain-containing protein n=1 Tax=Emticicia sp. TH156 TaxID=2067454 RepID=UPI000C783381|nr:toll/interleukin-1 receptor domain-containing protein [Emticicia sp. TH156]PLK43500.1 hypothetical protein C0V77_16500 [Emticicia sp. TH156]